MNPLLFILPAIAYLFTRKRAPKLTDIVPGRWRVKASVASRIGTFPTLVTEIASELDGVATSGPIATGESNGYRHVEFDFAGEEAPRVASYPNKLIVTSVRPLKLSETE